MELCIEIASSNLFFIFTGGGAKGGESCISSASSCLSGVGAAGGESCINIASFCLSGGGATGGVLCIKIASSTFSIFTFSRGVATVDD